MIYLVVSTAIALDNVEGKIIIIVHKSKFYVNESSFNTSIRVNLMESLMVILLKIYFDLSFFNESIIELIIIDYHNFYRVLV